MRNFIFFFLKQLQKGKPKLKNTDNIGKTAASGDKNKPVANKTASKISPKKQLGTKTKKDPAKRPEAKQSRKPIFEVMDSLTEKNPSKQKVSKPQPDQTESPKFKSKKVAPSDIQPIMRHVPGLGMIGTFKRTSRPQEAPEPSIPHGTIEGRRRRTKVPLKYKDSSIDPSTRKKKKAPSTPVS